ncbi:MAG: ATPase P [Deltaproteobacteria bacterium]|nr:ATPase P [Deltaproteobacteria bacterium]
MIEVSIPGFKKLALKHLVLDFNGTLACDGFLLPDVGEALNSLSALLDIHVLTADTFGRAAAQLDGVLCQVAILPESDQANGKLAYVEKLGAANCVSIGNGRNDQLMLKACALGIAVVLEEGASSETLQAADLVCTRILSALALMTNPLRLTATLRS